MREDASFLKKNNDFYKYPSLVMEERKFLRNGLQVYKQCKSPNGKSGRTAFHRYQGGIWYIPHRHFPIGNRIHTDTNTQRTLHKIEGNQNRYGNMAWIHHLCCEQTQCHCLKLRSIWIHTYSQMPGRVYVYLSPNVCKLSFKRMNESIRK